jgi:hypothetical protein
VLDKIGTSSIKQGANERVKVFLFSSLDKPSVFSNALCAGTGSGEFQSS